MGEGDVTYLLSSGPLASNRTELLLVCWVRRYIPVVLHARRVYQFVHSNSKVFAYGHPTKLDQYDWSVAVVARGYQFYYTAWW